MKTARITKKKYIQHQMLVENIEQLELSPTVGEYQNGPTTLGNFGKLGSLLQSKTFIYYDLTKYTKFKMNNHIHQTFCKTLETTKIPINRALINRV